MSGGKIRVGIVGAGRMGITHYAIINSHPDVEVTAVAEPSSVMRLFLDKSVKAATYKDAEAMFDKQALDAILLCTPPGLNYGILTAAHRKGLHAFVEKPFLLSVREGEELAALFDGSRLVNQVGYVNRFNDVFVAVKRYLQEGLLGEILRFRSEMYSSTVIREEAGEGWRSSHAKGGGATYEMASHAIDLINFLFGAPDKVAGSRLTQVFSKNVEDVVSSTFAYKSGCTGALYVNWSDASFRKPTNKLEVFGRRGKILADQHGLKLFLDHDDPERGFKKGWNTLYITDVFNPVPFYVRGVEFTAQLYHFIEKIKAAEDRRTICSFADATATLAVIDEIFRDAAVIEKEMV
jgi:predicted dehydrogenase